MRRFLPLVVLALFFGSLAYAQQATLNTPVTRASEDNLQVMSYYATADGGGRWEAIVAVRDSGGNEIRRESYSGPDAAHPAATAAAFNTAVINVRASETGTDVRKVRFRITGFLKDNGYIVSGTTLVP
jgi:hypothetical protein